MCSRLLCLDFDGVVLESVHIKDQAYHALFTDVDSGMRDKILAEHKATPGMKRGRKVAHLFTMAHGRPPQTDELAHYVARFAELVVKEMLACPYTPGFETFISGCKDKPIYLATAAPQAEVQDIARRRRMSWITEVFGNPTTKVEALREIARREDRPVSEVLFIGDGVNDLAAAREVGAVFLGRVPAGDLNPFPDDVPVFQDFARDAPGVVHALREGLSEHP
ncbi:HAD hydrolase-like protein [Magnetospira thiophila]